MADNIRLEIVTPEKQVFHQMVERFTVPATIGSTGILYNHAPLITALNPGVLTYVKDGKVGKAAVGAGFLEVHDNEAEILVACAELAEDIDVVRAMEARSRAERRLKERAAGIDRARATSSLARSLARLHAVGKL